jgi:uncharacterized membrane protein (Fun14 family)
VCVCVCKMEYSQNKQRAEYNRINEIETYFCTQKAPDMTLIGLSIIIGLYLNSTVAAFIIGLSILKLFILTVYGMIERKFYDISTYPITPRTTQFWLYRFIFLLQLFLLLWVLTDGISIR